MSHAMGCDQISRILMELTLKYTNAKESETLAFELLILYEQQITVFIERNSLDFESTEESGEMDIDHENSSVNKNTVETKNQSRHVNKDLMMFWLHYYRAMTVCEEWWLNAKEFDDNCSKQHGPFPVSVLICVQY
jgi:hypothetical protein